MELRQTDVFGTAKWIRLPIENVDIAQKYNPAPYIAKRFTVKKGLNKAVLHVFGYSEAAYFLNGKAIPDSYRPTVPCTLQKTVVYNDFDLSALLREGSNRLGIMLGMTRLRNNDRETFAIVRLDLEYSDGSRDSVVSDGGFRGTASPVVFSFSGCGEVYDANREIPGWCDADFDDSGWTPVSELPEAQSSEYAALGFRTSECPPVRKISEVPGREISPRLYDFGTTTSGYVRARITGKKGARITLKYAERLLPDGRHIDPSAYMMEKKRCPSMYNTDEYILDGTENKLFDQFFSIHGFRYVEVFGEYDEISLTAVVCHTDMKRASYFTCGDAMINKIHDACANSIATCLQTYFVDNPKRDAAWVGDQLLSAESTAMLFDSYSAHFENMLMCKDAMREDGLLPYSAPSGGSWTYNNFIGPDWSGGVIFTVPYYVYKYTKKREIVDVMWTSMEKSLDFFRTLGDGGYLINRRGTGDWSAVKPGCTLEVAMTVYYRECALIMAELAEALGRDSAKYRALAENIKSAYRAKYVANGKINGAHISEFILPVYCGMLEPAEKPAALSTVVDMIKSDGMAFTFGAHGLRMIFDVLSDGGHAQVLYDVLVNEKALGYARNIAMGYDTVPERFDWEKDGVFSLNHHFFSAPAAWLYKWVAGIKINGFGYDDVKISPVKIKGIARFDASMHGINVSLADSVLTVDSPYDFTLSLGGNSERHAAGRYAFPFA